MLKPRNAKITAQQEPGRLISRSTPAGPLASTEQTRRGARGMRENIYKKTGPRKTYAQTTECSLQERSQEQGQELRRRYENHHMINSRKNSNPNSPTRTHTIKKTTLVHAPERATTSDTASSRAPGSSACLACSRRRGGSRGCS